MSTSLIIQNYVSKSRLNIFFFSQKKQMCVSEMHKWPHTVLHEVGKEMSVSHNVWVSSGVSVFTWMMWHSSIVLVNLSMCQLVQNLLHAIWFQSPNNLHIKPVHCKWINTVMQFHLFTEYFFHYVAKYLHLSKVLFLTWVGRRKYYKWAVVLMLLYVLAVFDSHFI